jgi:hypothetical protein
MTEITMWDACANSEFPADGAAYAAYVDGGVGNQPNYSYITATFPEAKHFSIAEDPAHEADSLDVENGAATPAAVPGWVAAQKARGLDRPCIYASAWTMRSQILPVLADNDIARSSVRLWTAHYGAGRHVCGPASCGLVDVDADGTQWTDAALGRNLDESLLSPGFFTGKLPADWTYSAPLALSATGGHKSVRLQWQPPQGFPELPVAYRIWIYRGTRADKSTLVPTYFRDADNGALDWEGGGLEQGRLYCAHVAAMGPDATRMGSFVFASALFMTG